MAQLTRFDNDGIELVIDLQTGEAFITQTGYARMSGLSQQAVNKRCKGYNQAEFKTAELLTRGGLQAYNLIPAKLCFKWAMRDNPDLAEAMGEAGATVYLHQLAGYKVTSTLPNRPPCAILDRPDPWKRFFEKSFCDRVFNWFGAQFYWDYVYTALTPEEVCKVNLLNPPRGGVRPDKIHQYLTPEIKTRLTPYIRELVALADGAATRADFEIGYSRHFGKNDQLRLKGI